MLLRTHLVIGIFAILLFITHVSQPVYFVIVALAITVLPDIDTAFSFAGNTILARPLQFFTKHRGMFHSLTVAFVGAFILAVFYPSLSLAFFLGYSVHIFADSFTVEGVSPFWPYKAESKGLLRTGGRSETILFTVFIILDIFTAWFVFLA